MPYFIVRKSCIIAQFSFPSVFLTFWAFMISDSDFKLLEHIIDSNLMAHLSKWNILAENQHAFRKARSCESQLILAIHDITKNIDDGLTTDVAILDFSKAFDVIPHHRLLNKLDFYGIRSKTKQWITSFLTKRQQRVVVNGKYSNWVPVLSGVPQGTVLGPHLFLLHINDIDSGLTSTTRLFADDCLVYNSISSPKDEEQLQSDLNTMVDWSNTWGMKFNPSKCTTMRVSRKKNLTRTTYQVMGTTLEETTNNRYLGVILQNDMRWNKQVSNATNKAMKTLNFIKRNFYHTSTGTKEKLYSMLAKPHLNYATAAWDPHTTKNINELERIQNAAARFIKGVYGKDTSVTALKESLGWVPLQKERCRARVTCLYKMMHGKVDIDHKLYTSPKPDRSRRVHGQQFKIDRVRTDVHAYSFFPRTIKDWNNLPKSSVTETTVNGFKTSLQKVNLN